MTTKSKKSTEKTVAKVVTSIEDVYEAIGFDMATKRPYAEPADEWEEYLNACADEKVIVKHFNAGENVAYGIWGYVPVFRKYDHPSGFGFSRVGHAWTGSHSGVGSRAFVRLEDAKKAGQQFESVYSIIYRYDNK